MSRLASAAPPAMDTDRRTAWMAAVESAILRRHPEVEAVEFDPGDADHVTLLIARGAD